MHKKISIIIPAYNTVDVIYRTLTSVEQQTYPNYEIILINDGSTDGTKEFIDSYKNNKNNVVVFHQENKGVSSARNKGIELATGEFICFLDSDDTYEPTFLEEMIKRQQETGSDVVYCSYNTYNKENILKKEEINLIQESALSFYLANWFHLSTMLINRRFLLEKSIKFDTSKSVGEDSLFTVELLSESKSAGIKERLFTYYYRKDSTTNSIREEGYYLIDLESCSHIVKHIKENYKKQDRDNIILLAIKFKGLIELNYLIYLLSRFRYKDIKNYINKGITDLYMIENTMRKSMKRKFSFIKNNNYFLMFLGTIYYRYIRVNFKR